MLHRRRLLFVFLFLGVALPRLLLAQTEPDLLTVAETSDFRATSTTAQVSRLLHALAQRSDLLHVIEIGRSNDAMPLEVAIVADPPIATPAEAHDSGRIVTLLYGNIHAGEVCGKEAILMLARELVTTPDHPLLDDHVLLLLPNYNPDGNDRMSTHNRPGQIGPELGMGERHNAQDLDLNRDFTKLAAPETRALVKLLSDWQPHIMADTHTTNGSYHRYELTFDGPAHPSTHAPLRDFVMRAMLPTVSTRLRERTGYATFFYGNFDREHTAWWSYGADPRYSEPYMGLRHHMAILSEAYAYAPYKTRVLATLEFMREILRYGAEQKANVLRLCEEARAVTIERGRNPQPDDLVALRTRAEALPEFAIVEGWEMRPPAEGERRPQPTDVPRDYRVVHWGRFEAAVAVPRPFAYVLDADCPQAVLENLRQHGIEVEPFAGEARVETYKVTEIERAEREHQGHRAVSVDVCAEIRDATFADGAHLVRTAQPLGTLAVLLLEPQSTDGLTRWGYFDAVLEEGALFPVCRVRSRIDLD